MLTGGSDALEPAPATGDRPLGARPVRLALAAGVAAVAVAMWWLWPTFDSGVDVLVVGDGIVATAHRSIELRVRESGRSIEWYDASGWCDDLPAIGRRVDDVEPRRVVVAFTAGARCVDAAAEVLAGAAPLAVVDAPDGPLSAALSAAGFEVVDPSRLIGTTDGPATYPCEWWEAECAPGGTVVRDPAGALTEAGAERLARILVAAL